MRKRFSTLLVLAIMLTSLPVTADDLSAPLAIRPLNASFTIDPGPTTTYSKEMTIDTTSLYDPRYKLKSVSITDITIATSGPDLGTFNGTVKANGVTMFTYDGQWNEFNTAQSVLTSKLLKKNHAGINVLVKALTQGKPVVLSVSGVVGKAPAAKNANFITLYSPVQGSGLAL